MEKSILSLVMDTIGIISMFFRRSGAFVRVNERIMQNNLHISKKSSTFARETSNGNIIAQQIL